MSFKSCLRTTAIALGVLAGLCFAQCGENTKPEIRLIEPPDPMARLLAQECASPGTLLVAGTLTSNEPVGKSYFAVGDVSIMFPPRGIPPLVLKSYLGQQVEIIVRPVVPRKHQRIER